MTTSMDKVLHYLRAAVRDRRGAELTDGQLLESFLSRRETFGLEALVVRHGPMVWGVCRRLLNNHHDAEDAFQATFLVLVRKAAAVRPREMVGNWLYGVACQTALKARATSAKRRNRETQVADFPEPAVSEPDLWRDLRAVLDLELSRLPDKYRVAIVLCDLRGKTRKEAAAQLGCPEGTLAAQLARGRVMLAKRLARHGPVLSGGALATLLSQQASASLPTVTASATIKALMASASSAALSAKAAALIQGVVRIMVLHKIKVVATTLLLATVLGGGALGLGRQPCASADDARTVAKASSADELPKTPPAVMPADTDEEADRLDAMGDFYQRRGHPESAAFYHQLAAAKRGPTKDPEPPVLKPRRAPADEVPPPPTPKEAPADSPNEDALAESGAVRTANFSVTAPGRVIARLVADEAERQRKALALRWLGKELAPWSKPCPIDIKINSNSNSATEFTFADGAVSTRSMRLEGSLEQILASLLPHEITHTVLADHFGKPIPRWADEGAGVFAEDAGDLKRHDEMIVKVLDAPGRLKPLDELLDAKQFPGDLAAFYAEVYSLTRFLIERKDAKTFVAFVKNGMETDWNRAAKLHYGFADVATLEKTWLAHLSNGRPIVKSPPADDLVENTLMFATAQVKDRILVLNSPGRIVYRTVTSNVEGDDKAVRTTTAYHLVNEVVENRCELKEVQAWTADGKRVEPHTLRLCLKERTHVLILQDAKKVDPAFLKLLKDDTLIISIIPNAPTVSLKKESSATPHTAPVPVAPPPRSKD